ncbi:hypothetical protein G9A89_017588 [Geosiphon pyriformis]|nr:hypothetical protein G9A89_017588 [Geosiphon pyriformis]
MELVGLSAGGSGSGLAGLGTRQSAKNKHVDMVYARGVFYKKPKKPTAGISVELSAGLLCLKNLGGNNGKPAVSWGSRVGSISGSVSGLLDVENLENLVAKETSYIDSDGDDKMDETTLHRTHTRMYVLEQPLKAFLFATMNKDNDNSVLSFSKVNESNQLPSSKLCVLESRSFRPVKSFALDVNLSAVPDRTNNNKLISIKKIFYKIDGFEGASTLSKFLGVICSTFTNESSLIKAREIAVREKIVVNSNFKKTNIRLNWEVVIKEIPVDLPKVTVESAQIEFESSEVTSLVASKWSVLVGKNSVCVALAVCDKQITSAYDLSDLLISYGGKTCFIGRNPSSYVHDWCAIISFKNEAARLAAVYIIPIFKGVSLHWASLVLASCTKCEQFGHITVNCSVDESSGIHKKRVVSDHDRVHLAGIYKKKSAPIVCLVLFGGKTWAQVASGTPSCAFPSGSSGSGLHSGLVPPLAVSDPLVVSHLDDHLAVLECSLELLANRVSGILVRLDSFGMVPAVSSFLASSPVASAALGSGVNSNIIVDNALGFSDVTSPITDDAVVDLSASSSKVLTTKVGSLKTKLVTLEASVGSVLDKLNFLCSGLGLSAPTVSQ